MKDLTVFKPYKDDLQINGFSIVAKLEQAYEAIEAKDFEKFGYIMGEIMKLANMKKAEQKFTMKEPKPQRDMRDVTEVLQGFYAGTGVSMPFMQLLMCIYQADQAALELYADVQLWEEAFRDKSWFEGLFAVVFLFAFGQAVRGQVLPICVPLKETNWAPFDKVVSVVEDPINHMDIIGRDISVNGQSITTQIEAAAELCLGGKLYECGFAIGSTFASAVEDKQELFLY